MLTHYALIGVFLIAAIAFPILPLVLARLMRPDQPTQTKLDTYECGLEVIGDIRVQFKVQYYLYALAFVIFDIEVIFLYPWAVALNQLGLFGLIGMIVFVVILADGLAYAWKKGALKWV